LANLALMTDAQFIFSSAAIVCGVKAEQITRDTPVDIDTDYGKSKWLAEELVIESGAKHCILRIGGVFGFNGPDHLGLNRIIIDVINKKPFKKSSNIPVIIMAGGKGTRLDPFTRILPKPLIPIGNEPIIEIIMNEFSGYGVSEFHLTLNDKSKMIKAYFHDHSFKYKIHFIEEKKPLGTAGALRLIPLNNVCSIIVTNCDIIIKDDYNRIIEYHEEMENDITLIGSLQHYKVPYGVCKVGEKGNLKSIMEKPEYDYLSNTGFYILEKSILKLIPKDRYFDMTDLINKALGDNFKVGVYPVSDRSWIDIGQWEEYRKAVNALT